MAATTTYTCNFTIPGGNQSGNGPKGGRLGGTGFGSPSQPKLISGDQLQVVVQFNGPNAPNSLNGYFIMTAANDAPSSQTYDSPFLDGNGNFQSYFAEEVTGTGGSGNSPTSYTFGPRTYNGKYPGKYEFNVVLEGLVQNIAVQWSDDPEFETGI